MDDKQIIQTLIDELNLDTAQNLSNLLGYAKPSYIYMILSDTNQRPINSSFIKRVLAKFPNINENFLRGKSDEIYNKDFSEPASDNLTLNDLPGIMLKVLEELKKSNELLKQITDK